MATMYALPALTLWDNNPGGWSDTSGGPSNGLVPDSTTDVVFNVDSGATRTITFDGIRECKTFFGGSSNFAFDGSLSVYGNATLTLAVVTNLALSFEQSGALTAPTTSRFPAVYANASGVVVTLANPLNTAVLTLAAGSTFTASTFDVTVGLFTANGTATVNMGSGTWLIDGNSNAFTVAGTCTVNASTSVVRLTGTSVTFDGGGKTYNNFWWDSINTCTIVGANTFNDVKITGSSANLVFPASTTTTLATLNVDATAYAVISLRSSASGTPATITKSSGGTVMVYNCQITDIAASPASTFFATRSLDSGGNTGWTFLVVYSGFFFHM
jgi:hypothetical protein